MVANGAVKVVSAAASVRACAVWSAGSETLLKVLLSLRGHLSSSALPVNTRGHAGALHLRVVAHGRVRVGHVLKEVGRGRIGSHYFHLIRYVRLCVQNK
jgi:hypothetical protein